MKTSGSCFTCLLETTSHLEDSTVTFQNQFSHCRVVLEVDQPNGSTNSPEVDRATGSTYLSAYSLCIRRQIDSLTVLLCLPSLPNAHLTRLRIIFSPYFPLHRCQQLNIMADFNENRTSESRIRTLNHQSWGSHRKVGYRHKWLHKWGCF